MSLDRIPAAIAFRLPRTANPASPPCAQGLAAVAGVLAVFVSAVSAPAIAVAPGEPIGPVVASAMESPSGDWVVGNVTQGDAGPDSIRVEWGALAGTVLVEQPAVGVQVPRKLAIVRDGRLLRFGRVVEVRVRDVRGSLLAHESTDALDLADLPPRTVLVQATDPVTGSTTTFRLANPSSRN